MVLVAQRWSEVGEHGVAVKLAASDRLLQAPIGCIAERRGSNQSWRYRIHRHKSQIEYARSGGVRMCQRVEKVEWTAVKDEKDEIEDRSCPTNKKVKVNNRITDQDEGGQGLVSKQIK